MKSILVGKGGKHGLTFEFRHIQIVVVLAWKKRFGNTSNSKTSPSFN